MPIIVSDSAAEETLQAYTNPLSIQTKALNDLSEKVLNGSVVSDGNNPFTFLTEFASNMTASLVNKACECFNGLYPVNAQTATELYRHLSDFGYIGLYATPASTTVQLVFDRNFLIDNALEVSEEERFNEDPSRFSGVYSKIIIPSYSKFTIGDSIFGLMYPIEIRVRKSIRNNEIDYANSVITVMWDTTNENPLMPLTSHILEHRDFLQDGQMLTAIEIPVYQFEITNHLENAIWSTGFAKRYDFSNKFYAIRVFHFKNGEWNELHQTFSDAKYDPDIPTAIVKVLTDIGKVEVVIPHTYFTTNDDYVKIGNRILVAIYTTKGAMNVDLTEYKVDQFQASFLLTDTNLVEDDRYSNMLKRIPTVYVLPLSLKISSGTNGLSFTALKNRVKYDSSFTVKITPQDLQNYFNTSGYKFTKVLDNITDRVYYAHKVLVDKTNTPIASGQGVSFLPEAALNIVRDDDTMYVPGYSTLTILNENTITILPSSIYKYNEEEDRFYLLSDAEVSDLQSLTLEEKVAELNNNLYTYSPFHTVLSYTNNAPLAGTYDMFKPAIKDRIFEWENERTTVEISIHNASIEVDPDGGYLLKISIFKTANISDVPTRQDNTDNFKLMLSTYGKNRVNLYMIGNYEGTDKDGKDVFVFKMSSDFKITENDEVFISTFKDGKESQNNPNNTPNGGYVDMGFHDYTVSLFMLGTKLEEYAEVGFNDSNTYEFNIPNEMSAYILLCRQGFKVKLGESLPLIQNNIEITTTEQEFSTYATTQFATYQTNVYDRYTIDDVVNNVVPASKLNMLKLDENNKPIVKYKKGDVILSSRYDLQYGPVITMSNPDTEEVETLELDYDDEHPIPSSSLPESTFTTMNGDLSVRSKQYNELNGVFKIVDRDVEDTERVWTHVFNTTKEVFDISQVRTRAYTRTQNADGTYSHSLSNGLGQMWIFFSSNNVIITRRVGNSLVPVNTSARGYDRKWFAQVLTNLSDPQHGQFDFENYTGYVIEYNYSTKSESLTGPIKTWVLNYYYTVTDELGNKEVMCTTVEDDILNKDVITFHKESIEQDSYSIGYQQKEHEIKYVEKPDETTNSTYYALQMGVKDEDPLYEARCYEGNNSVRQFDPWEVDWKPVTEGEATPIVTCLRNTEVNHTLRVVDALKYIESEISSVEYATAKLYRNPNSLKEDESIESKMFVSVTKCDDLRSDSSYNRMNYNPGSVDPVTTGTLELGTATAKGAIYYRDLEATTYDYTEDGLTSADVSLICKYWDNGRKNGDSDAKIYDELIAGFTPDNGKMSVPLTRTLLSKIVSSTKSSFYSPWIKLLTSSSNAALVDYNANRDSTMYGGFIAIISEVDGEDKYINLLSHITRTEQVEQEEFQETAFMVNPENTTWTEIDKWPWEYDQPWFDLTTHEKSGLKLSYNPVLSSTQVLYGPDTVKLDEDGNPIVAKERALTYGVDMIHCDYKLSLSEDAEYSNYIEDVRELLRAYFNELKAITPTLLARTKLYFSPIRTFGHAEFRGSNGSTQMLPVQFSVEFGLQIESYVKNDTLSQKTIRQIIIGIIDQDTKDGILNLAETAKSISKELSDNVLYVDVLGLNGNKVQQTMIPVNEDTYPQLKQILVLYEDNTIHVDRALDLDWYVIK